MSIATQITRLNNNINSMKTTKQEIKDAMNNDFDIIANEQIEDYAELIEEGLELYKDCIPSEVTNQATEINVTDAAKYSRNKLELFGNTEQASYTGKNLLPSDASTRTLNDVVITKNNDGSYTLTGTASALTAVKIGDIQIENGKTYTMSSGNSDDSSNSYRIDGRKTVGSIYNSWSTASKPTLTVTEDVTIGIYIRIANGYNCNNVKIYPQVEEGSTATDYEQYVGGVPAPNPDYPQDIHVVTGENTVEVQGKNIANINQSNTNNTQYQNIFFKNNQLKTNTEYTISFAGKPGDKYRISSGTYGVATATQTITVDNNGIGIAHFTTKTEFTSQSTGILNNAVAGNTLPLTQICLVEGNYQTLPYEPYYHQDYPINLSSKNLFDKNNANILNALISSDGTLHASSTEKTLYIKCKPNTTYTISKIKSKRLRADERSTVPTIGSANVNRITNDSRTSMTYTTSENGNYLLVGYYINTDEVTEQQILDSIQIEEGSTATSYQAYYNVELCKIGDYQDYLYKENGNWYKYGAIGKVVLDGSESWQINNTASQGNTNYFSSTVIDGLYQKNTNIGYSNYFIIVTNLWNNDTQAMQLNNESTSNIRLRINKTIVADRTELRNWLTTHNVILYYVLVTPTSTQITDETLISQLDAIYEHLQLQKGINNITITPGDLAPYMKLSYKNYESNLTNE